MSWMFAWGTWVVAAIVFAILEIFLPASVFLGFAIGAAVVAGLLALGGVAFVGGTVPWMMVIFAAVSLIAWLVLRRVFALRKGQVKVWKTDINE